MSFVGFDPRPVVKLDNYTSWTFSCQWCNAYYRPFFIEEDNIKNFRCSCGKHPLSKYNFK